MIKNSAIVRLFLFAAILSGSTSQAQTSRTLSLQQAMKEGLEASKTMKVSMAKLEQARAKYEEAVDGALPSFRLSAGYTKLSDIDQAKIKFPGQAEPISLFPVYTNNYTARLSLNETVFSGFRLKYAMESQRLLQKAAEMDTDKDKEDLLFTIANAYFNLYKLKISKRLVDENLDQVKEHLRETEVWEKEGIATHNDVLRWQLQQSTIELTQMDIQNSQDIANYNFNIMLGLNGDTRLDIDTTEVEAIQTPGTLNEYLQEALKNRGDLLAIDLRAKAANNNVKVAKNSYLPQVGVGGNYYDSRPNSRFIPPVDEFRTSWDVGVNLTWDLMSLYTNKHYLADAKGLYRQAEETKNGLSDAVRMEVNQNYLSYIQSREKIRVMQKAVEQATENYRLMDSRYRNSLVVLSDLLDASSILLQSQINKAMAKADVQIAYYRLLKSTGTIN